MTIPKMITYRELRELSPAKARQVVRNVLRNNRNNVFLTAKILRISRKTVRRARDGSDDDCSRRPKKSPNKIQTNLEEIIKTEGKETGYRYRRLSKYINNKFGITISENTVKAVLRRNKIQKKTIRTRNNRIRPLYDYEHLAPFTEFQLDTKHVLDYNALPEDVYIHILRKGLPKYEWNIIDVITKTRFTAYSHELSATFGWLFMFMVIYWLRANNVRSDIHIQADNGVEFCSGSKSKEEQLNILLAPLGASFSSIDAGKHYKQGVVENSHRHDDEQFLSIHPIRCPTTEDFIVKAQRWQDTWNTARPSWGIGMKGITPLQKLNSFNSLISTKIMTFPVLLLENSLKLSGTYVHTNCHFNIYR